MDGRRFCFRVDEKIATDCLHTVSVRLTMGFNHHKFATHGFAFPSRHWFLPQTN
jgi:hypothetical protein